jgi:intron-binding protein aquarius
MMSYQHEHYIAYPSDGPAPAKGAIINDTPDENEAEESKQIDDIPSGEDNQAEESKEMDAIPSGEDGDLQPDNQLNGEKVSEACPNDEDGMPPRSGANGETSMEE